MTVAAELRERVGPSVRELKKERLSVPGSLATL